MTKEDKEKIEYLMNRFVHLNDFEKQFCQSLYKVRNGKFDLSIKQLSILDKTFEHFKGMGFAPVKKPDDGLIALTEEIFQKGQSKKGGWNAAQLNSLGESFEKGWRKRIIGKYYSKEKIEKFLSLRTGGAPNSYKPTNKIDFTPQEKDEIVKLAIDCAEDYNTEHLIAWFQKKTNPV